MATAAIQISEELKELARQRALAAGYANVDEYVRALIVADTTPPISAELEAHLLRALESPAREITPADWDRKRNALSALAKKASQ
ncbi:MAG TPA: hypothetical protein VLJ39_04420 [Tepidisphaeraceae bacterium]|nr:hypothetical protein [Tepidisphaeraceae bacterium]